MCTSPATPFSTRGAGGRDAAIRTRARGARNTGVPESSPGASGVPSPSQSPSATGFASVGAYGGGGNLSHRRGISVGTRGDMGVSSGHGSGISRVASRPTLPSSAAITHRLLLTSSQPSSTSDGVRPLRTPWAVLYKGSLVAAAKCAEPCDVEIWHASRSNVAREASGSPRGFEFLSKLVFGARIHGATADAQTQVDVYITALGGIPDDSYPFLLVGLSNGDVAVVKIDSGRLLGDVKPWGIAFICKVSGPLSGSISHVDADVNGLLVAAKTDGTVCAWDMGDLKRIGSDADDAQRELQGKIVWKTKYGGPISAMALKKAGKRWNVSGGSSNSVISNPRNSNNNNSGDAMVIDEQREQTGTGNDNSSNNINSNSSNGSSRNIGPLVAVADEEDRVTVLCASSDWQHVWGSNGASTGIGSASESDLCVDYGATRALCWRYRADELVLGGEDDRVYIHDGNKRRRLTEQDEHQSFVTGVASRGECIASAGMDGRIVIWRDGVANCVFHNPYEAFYQIAWPEKGVLLASAVVDAQGNCNLYRIALRDRRSLAAVSSAAASSSVR